MLSMFSAMHCNTVNGLAALDFTALCLEAAVRRVPLPLSVEVAATCLSSAGRAVVRLQHLWGHLYQLALLLEPAMLAAIFASSLSALVRLGSLFLPLFAQLKDNCLGSPPPSPYQHHRGRRDVSTNRLGQQCCRQALWSLLRLRYLREGKQLAAHLCERRERQREET